MMWIPKLKKVLKKFINPIYQQIKMKNHYYMHDVDTENWKIF
jgi:hypothetical protein